MIDCIDPHPVRLQDIVPGNGACVPINAKSARDALYTIRGIVEDPVFVRYSQVLQLHHVLVYRCLGFSAYGDGEVVDLQIEIFRVASGDARDEPLYITRITPVMSTNERVPCELSPGFGNLVRRLVQCRPKF